MRKSKDTRSPVNKPGPAQAKAGADSGHWTICSVGVPPDQNPARPKPVPGPVPVWAKQGKIEVMPWIEGGGYTVGLSGLVVFGSGETVEAAYRDLVVKLNRAVHLMEAVKTAVRNFEVFEG